MNELFIKTRAFIKTSGHYFLIAFLCTVIAIGSVTLFHLNFDTSFKTLTNNVTDTANVPVYFGFLSQVGTAFWVASGALCLFTYWITNAPSAIKSFLLASGCITLYLVIDDVFLFHKKTLPDLGIPQNIVCLSYSIGIAWFTLKFKTVILNSNFVLLACAYICLGLSILIRILSHNSLEVFTEFAKFTGIIFWLLYYADTCKAHLKPIH